MMKWIKCSDRLPELERVVLVYYGAMDISHLSDVNLRSRNAAKKRKDDFPVKIEWYSYDSKFYSSEVTHWMPLPEKPDEVD